MIAGKYMLSPRINKKSNKKTKQKSNEQNPEQGTTRNRDNRFLKLSVVALDQRMGKDVDY